MPLCVVCYSRFYYQTQMEPAEPCDCGECWTKEQAEQDFAGYQEAMARVKSELEKEQK